MSNLKIKIKNHDVPVSWENMSAVGAIMNKLSSVKKFQMTKNGIKHIGNIGIPVPRNDRAFNARPGDIAIQDGNLVIFSGEDDVSCTKLGKISGYSETQIKSLLSSGSINVELYEG